jgi:hypothetical protein
MQPIVQQAIKALKINVPVMRYEIKGRKVTLWLYGHSKPRTWTKRAPRKKEPAQ